MDLVPLSIAIVLSLLLAYVVLSSLFDFFSKDSRSPPHLGSLTGDPNEIEAKRYGWDTWSPHDRNLHGASLALEDLQSGFTGSMESIGCMFSCTNSENPAWFGKREQLIDFVESDYLFLTHKYMNRDKEPNSLEYLEASYEDIVISRLKTLQEKDNWGVDDVIKILKKFSPCEQDDIEWFTFKYICYEGDDENCFREDFRSTDGEYVNDAPINDDELEEFKAYMLDRPNRRF